MKRIAAGFVVISLPFAVMAAPESYTLDPYHTYPHFEVEHLGMSKMRGRFDKSAGKFTIDHTAKTGSLELTVQTASITTGDNDRGSRPRSRDEHLRAPDFFNTAEFPTMSYRTTKVNFKSDAPDTIEGQLTLIGVTRPITLHVENFKCGPHPASKKAMCGGNAVATLKRSDFGMKYGIPAVSDELKLWFEFEGYKD